MTIRPFMYVDGCVVIIDTHTCLGIRCIRGEWEGSEGHIRREEIPGRNYRSITWLEVLTRTGTSRNKCEEILRQHIKRWRLE